MVKFFKRLAPRRLKANWARKNLILLHLGRRLAIIQLGLDRNGSAEYLYRIRQCARGADGTQAAWRMVFNIGRWSFLLGLLAKKCFLLFPGNCSRMRQYLDLLDDILTHGVKKEDRTGTGTLSVFGRQSRYDLSQSFPLLTTKKLHFKSIVIELLWFLRGETNTAFLRENGVSIWDEWSDADGELGPVYGKQWRSWPTPDGEQIDQIADVIQGIRQSPDSRRLIVSAWNVGQIEQMALPPCHLLFQFYVAEGRLSCQLYQRSADVFLGVPFNIASYGLLTIMIAQLTGLQPGEFIHTLGDAHLYTNHLEQARTQLAREPRPCPTIRVNPEVSDINDFQYSDFQLLDYDPHPHIRAPVAV